jgi:hypothetical protein
MREQWGSRASTRRRCGSKLDRVPVGIRDVCVGDTGCVLAALDESPAGRLDLRDRPVEVDALVAKKTEVLNGCRCVRLVQRDHVFGTWQLEEHHLVAHSKCLCRTEDALIEQERSLDIRDIQMNVVQTARRDHTKTIVSLEGPLAKHSRSQPA